MLQVNDIYKSYGTLEVLKGINLSVDRGEIVSITGASGAGKTTLLQIMGTLDRPDRGSVIIDGTDVCKLNERSLAEFRNQHLGFIFQFHQLLPEFTALENVMLPALIGKSNTIKARKRALELLDFLSLSERINHKPTQLSGGEKQRVAVARALINKPDIILADEPSGSLDTVQKGELHKLFAQLRADFNQTFVIITHDTSLANSADRVISLRDGEVELNNIKE